MQTLTTVVWQYVRHLREAFPRQDPPPRRKPSVTDVAGWITRHPNRSTPTMAGPGAAAALHQIWDTGGLTVRAGLTF